ncbi:MAG: sigma-70 family RNA polymerase sigma factor [Bacteroidia bacterium]|nr:sigma-70 family RNA polymerase sigma factor [Bacteroidia bacterium]
MNVTEELILTWVSECKQQNRHAQEKLYKHFYPLLMPVCMSYVTNNDDAVDVYNQAFLKVFKSLDKYSGQGALGGWIRRIVVNTAIDFIRKEKKMALNVPIEDAMDCRIDADVVAQLTSNEILDLFRFLPPAQRLVLNLYIVEGKTHAEIAEQLDISTGTSKWHLNQGRKLLQEKIYEFGILTK